MITLSRAPTHLSILSLALVAAACGRSGPAAAASGVEGVVLIGPMCPVVRADTPCPDQPFQSEIRVEDASGLRLTQFQTEPTGRFRVELAPGNYTLVPLSPNDGGPPSAAPVPVTVPSGRFVRVTITYDSGIR